MAEYRIVAKVDPQTGAGSQKVKQDLRGIQTEAKATESALNRSFDQAKFDKTIGGLVNRIDQLDGKLRGAGATAAQAGKGFDTATGSLEHMTAAEFRAAGGLDGLNKSAAGASGSNARLEASLRRVLQATDAEAAEQMKLNALLKDAKLLLDANMISAERYAQVQRVVAGAGKEVVTQSGAQRIGFQQLGFQLGDMATMYSLGAKPAQIFASQIGQVSQALMLMGGSGSTSMLGKVAGFLGGPWGIALTLAVTLLGPFVGKLFESNDALDDAVDKLRKDAQETETTRQAHERWIHTLDALIARQGDLADAIKKRLQVQGLDDQRQLAGAQADRVQLEAQLTAARNQLAQLQQARQRANAPVEATGRGAEMQLGQQALALSRIDGQIKASQSRIDQLQTALQRNAAGTAGLQILVGEQTGKAMVDMTARAKLWGDTYQSALRGIMQSNEAVRAQAPTVSAGFELVRAAIEHAGQAGVQFGGTMTKAKNLGLELQSGKIGAAGYRTEMAKLAATLEAAAKAAEQAGRKVGDGVARFMSAKQAIGIAGRELQQAGLHVGENSQFGGVTPGVHTGAGHREDRAIDVDIAGASDKFPTPPNIMQKYDAVARRYAARGYIVLWAGQRYDPSGKVTPITSGDKHYGHMHVEAPGTIVGKATQASTEAQAAREQRAGESDAQKAANVAREQGDFVTSIIDQQAMRGMESGPESLNARMEKIVGDYKRRFNVELMPEADQKRIRDALIGGDVREIQKGFDDAYVKPLERLTALQGKTGLDRAVLNAQLEKTAELKRQLTPVENAEIENGIRRGDQLQREASLLEQVRGPLDEYQKTIAALNSLLAQGSINQSSYNARIAEMANSATQAALSGLTGVDPSGRSYQDLSAISEESARYAKQLEAIDDFRKKKLDIGVSYDQLELSAAQQHQQNLAQIDQARRDVTLRSFEDMAGSLTDAMKSMFGEQSRMYKAAFAIEKAVAIARSIVAIQTGIAQAAALPFPANLPAIASVVAATASIISNIEAVALNFKDGGRVTGPGGPRSDSVRANLSRDEFVVNADATRRNLPLLEAINDGREVRQAGRARAVDTARTIMAASPPPVVVPAPEVRVVNVSDPRAALNALNTAEGRKVLMNVLESDPNTFRRLLGAS